MPSLKILFATNFSDSCFRAIRAVAQLADLFEVRITLAHSSESGSSCNREINSFFAEADHYGFCRRLLLSGKTEDAVTRLAREEHFDLIIAPGSDRIGIPRPFHRSLRAAILHAGVSPVWTSSRALEEANFRRPIRTIAVGMDGRHSDIMHLELASAFAGMAGAKLRLLTVVPSVDEGTMVAQALSPEPLHPDAAMDRIASLLNKWNCVPDIDVAVGSAGVELPRMAARCDADLLFLPESQSARRILLPGISRAVNYSPCAVICVPTTLPPQFNWSFASKTRRRELAA